MQLIKLRVPDFVNKPQELVTTFLLVLGNEKASKQVFNISGEKYITFDGLAKACAKAAGFPEPKLVHYNPKEFDFGKKEGIPLLRSACKARGSDLGLHFKAAVNEAHYAEENRLEQICLKRYDYFGLSYADVVTVEGIKDVLEVHASLFVEGIAVVQDLIFV
ncbi:hypothetical protein Scep_006526 [Stephania cephalantha]|uniref:Uncharacterized protein n=1 Tax=Stephania cephalantha TaxID=152367 RepID=A0AAP0KA20_9MAGN